MMKISGEIYLVKSTHYMGMDGTFVDIVAAYTDYESAERRVRKEELKCTHKQSDYDVLYWGIDSVELVC
jgi:hypothetical protein